jgi:hypothetical protein
MPNTVVAERVCLHTTVRDLHRQYFIRLR